MRRTCFEVIVAFSQEIALLLPEELLRNMLHFTADPFANDESFLLSMLTLEELGATGNKVCFAIVSAPLCPHPTSGLMQPSCKRLRDNLILYG